MQCQFVVGQKVVCVLKDTSEPEGHVFLEPIQSPEVGKVYTIKKVTIGQTTRNVCVLLEEIPHQRIRLLIRGELFDGDVLFPAAIFRAIETKKTDISIFTRMLNPSKVPA